MKLKFLCLFIFTFNFYSFSQKNISVNDVKKIEKNGLT